jgi:hypothetical protein
MKNTAAASVAPRIITAKVEMGAVQPKKGSVRLNASKAEKNPITDNIYISRTKLAFLGLPEGHVPTKVRVTVEVLESAVESTIEAPAAEAKA